MVLRVMAKNTDERTVVNLAVVEGKWNTNDLLDLCHVIRSTKPKRRDDGSSVRPNPRVRSPTENERFMVKEESAASVGTRPWTPEGRSLTLSIAFVLQLGIMEWPSRLG
ncbi:hypothetical protein AVEN_204112-1 [Araneus ventricosus]|uniref:Uncharacterized protein n=1 Tax=Araneus ventricosus TaxID=182803 RepID=A0A4Y2SXE8_ARAVE|nr:hypothetical protein AVEN_204112-1 [Araneus ventricosus]